MFHSRSTVTYLYKYLEPKWADAMIRTGTMRIGTLEVYRDLEAKDAERGDIGEGTRTLHSDDMPRVYNSTAELPPVLQGISCGPRGLATNGPNAIVINNRVPNVYVYCLTEQFDRTVMASFGGACVRIEKPAEFFAAVDDCFRIQLQEIGLTLYEGTLDHCVYVERHQNYHAATQVHDCFLKPPKYEHQHEVRAIWCPTQLPIEPKKFECLAGAQFCLRHA